MNLMIKSVVLMSVISIPAIAAISHDSAWSEAVGLVHELTASNTSTRAKDETRPAPFAGDDDLADFTRPAPTSDEPTRAGVRLAQAFGPPFASGGPPAPHGAFAPMGPHMGMEPPPPRPSMRARCEDRVDSELAMAAYVKAKLRLQPAQREAWQKLETASQSAIDKVRAACAGFPTDASIPPSLPEMLDAVEAELSARVELLRATREPLRALYASLTPEQRGAVHPFLPPPHAP